MKTTTPNESVISEKAFNSMMQSTINASTARLRERVDRLQSIVDKSTCFGYGKLVTAEIERIQMERDALRQENQELKADKARLDWLEKQPATALWHGEFSDSYFNIKLGRVGAPIFTVSSMDLDGTETDTEMGGGDTLRTAIDEAMKDKPV